jgi:Ca2+-binding RTX toxin-like protein
MHVAWLDQTTNYVQVRTIDAGGTLANSRKVSDVAYAPSLTLVLYGTIAIDVGDDGTEHVAWIGYTNHYALNYRSISVTGAMSEETEQFATMDPYDYQQDIHLFPLELYANASGGAHLIWISYQGYTYEYLPPAPSCSNSIFTANSSANASINVYCSGVINSYEVVSSDASVTATLDASTGAMQLTHTSSASTSIITVRAQNRSGSSNIATITVKWPPSTTTNPSPPPSTTPPPAPTPVNACPFGTSEGVVCTPIQGGGLRIVGTADSDTIVGTDARDIIDAGAGDDVVFGNSGNDSINGGAGSDRLMGMGGADTILSGLGRDELLGGAGNDVIRASGKTDRDIDCGDGRDKLFAARRNRRDAIDCEILRAN